MLLLPGKLVMPVPSRALRIESVMRHFQITCWLSLLFVLLTPAGHAFQITSVREADASCAKCHAEIYRKYLTTPMANASGAAASNLHTGTFLHQPSSVEYKISAAGDQAVLAHSPSGGPGASGEVPLNYFLGSGHLATTYLYSIDKYLFESPVAWFASPKSFDMKPGLAEMREMPPALPMQSSCLRCHMSSVQSSDTGTLNRYQGAPFLHAGITCEACHGDSAQHIATQGKAAIVNPKRLPAEQRDSICISCHLEGDVTVERAGHTALDYRPGAPISKYLAYYIKAGANLTTRGVSEVEQLSQSMCKRMSGDKMSCSSCHDPHYTPGTEERITFFRGKCLACHSEPNFASQHHPENPDCTSCHMPRLGAANILHVAWTDHRILRLPESSKSIQETNLKAELVPIFSPEATERDRAMAYYQALLEGDRSMEGRAWELLKQQRDSIANDKAALDALGNLSAERGDLAMAEQSFRRVLELDPADLTALSNLGTLLAKEGKLNDATALLRKAFDRNNDVSGLAMNLARVECMAGDGIGARSTLNTALLYFPNSADMRRLLMQVSDCKSAGER